MNASFRPPTSVRHRLDDEISAFLRREREAFEPDCLDLLDDIVRLVGSGGKRLRPLFCYWGHLACDGRDDDRILRAAGALEMLHTFAIIHDDIMDRSALRRGGPASHESLAAKAGGERSEGFGVAAAILAGDLAMVLADRMLSESGFETEAVERARGPYDRMRVQAISGQYLDLRASQTGAAGADDARRIATLKSGSYTVTFPLLIGAALAGPADDRSARLEAYGLPLGEAFQLRDDVLGLFGDPAVTGKDRHSDLREGKQTLLVALARQHGSVDQRRLLDEGLGRPDLSAADAERIRQTIRATGALDETLRVVEDLGKQAVAALDGLRAPRSACEALEEMASYVVVRDL